MAITPSSTRFVTGHDKTGNSVFLYDSPIVTFASPRNGAQHALLWSAGNPPDLSDDKDTQEVTWTTLHTGAGSTLRLVTFPPQTVGYMHRTETIDYVIMQKGEVVLELEGGGERLVREGDVVVQRGTNHAWHNRTDQPCQFMAVLITAALPEIDGKQIKGSHK